VTTKPQASDFKPIIYEAKPDPELIINSMLEHFIYLKFHNSFRGINNDNFAFAQSWDSQCPDGKYGNYELHGEYYLSCNSSSNKFKFANVAQTGHMKSLCLGCAIQDLLLK
jgi:hypothetical protein